MNFFLILLTFFVFGIGNNSNTNSIAQDLPRVELSIEKTTCYVGEPLYFTIKFHNNQDTPVKAFFNVPPYLILAQRKGGDWRCSRYEPMWVQMTVDYCSDPIEIPTEGEWSGSGKLFGFGRPFLLSEPGEYEFKVKFHNILEPNLTYESHVVEVRVINPPTKEKEALAAFRDEAMVGFLEGNFLIKYGESSESFCKGDHPKAFQMGAEKALAFLEKYPNSFYASIVRKLSSEVITKMVKEGKDRLTPELQAICNALESLSTAK